MTEQRTPDVIYDSHGPSGNIFAILGQVKRTMKNQQRSSEFDQLWNRVNQSGSYEEALEIIGEYVNLVDIHTEEAEM